LIEKIGVICQDANSLGFLKGLKARLKCQAELIPAPAVVGKSTTMTRRQAKNAWAFFKKNGVDLIIRFTDADNSRWQDVQRSELEIFPEPAKSILVCGVAVRNTEHWLGLMQSYLAETINLPKAQLRTATTDPTNQIKARLRKMREFDQDASDVVALIVENAPTEAFQLMLQHNSFQKFYGDCRAEAKKSDCDVPNELHSPGNGPA